MKEITDVDMLVMSLFEGLYTLDRERRITGWNRAAEGITGYSAGEVIGSRCSDNILMHVDSQGNEMCSRACPAAACMNDGQYREAKVYLHHKMGHRVPVQVRVFPSTDGNGGATGAIELFKVVDSSEKMTSKIRMLENQAMTDPLTKLPNRRFVEDGIEASIALFKRTGVPFAAIFIDIDDMKMVNDEYGHAAGDRLLETVARTISSCARPRDIIGRWGGDEFAGYLPGTSLEGARILAERLGKLIAHSAVTVSNDEIRVTVSVGVSLVNENDTLHSIVDRADGIMYEVKKSGGNGVSSERR